MSGPLYPPGPQPGSNVIGKFTIGVSPIGTIPPFDYWLTIISQYANSPILTQLITNMFAYIDQTQNFDNFFDDIFNVDTAQGYGLDVWGRRVGVIRTISVAAGAGKTLGFAEQRTMVPPNVDPNVDPFNQSPFYAGGALTNNFSLTDAAFRTLIYAKMLTNISNGSIQAINALLRTLFPNMGNAYIVDGLNMTMQYVFNFALTPVQQAILSQSGVLPKPVGVSATIVVL